MQVFFTCADNLVGLEQAVVIVTGFHLYEHMVSRLKLPFESRVDSGVFIAVSQCTYKPIFVECQAAEKFAWHFEISRAAHSAKGRAVVRARCITLGIPV